MRPAPLRDVALALCASPRHQSVALRLADGSLHRTDAGELRQARDLTAAVAGLFAAQGLGPERLGEIRLDLGPGSYTGLRVAVTFARMANAFHGVVVYTATSLQLQALAMWEDGSIDRGTTIRPVFDARRERFYEAPVLAAPQVHCPQPPQASTLEELGRRIGRSEAIVSAAAMAPTLEGLAAARGATWHPSLPYEAALLFSDALQLAPAAAELQPLYLMGSYAEPPGRVATDPAP